MKIEDLEARLKAKARANVKARVSEFEKTIDDAMAKLFETKRAEMCGKYATYANSRTVNEDYRKLCDEMAQVLWMAAGYGDKQGKEIKIPAGLFDRELEKLRAELLAKMDLMQQLLMIPASEIETTLNGEETSDVSTSTSENEESAD